MPTRDEVFQALNTERDYQDAKGAANGGAPHKHELESYVIYMEDYLAELRNQLSRIWVSDGKPPTVALDTLRKVTALGVAAMEEHGAPQRSERQQQGLLR